MRRVDQRHHHLDGGQDFEHAAFRWRRVRCARVGWVPHHCERDLDVDREPDDPTANSREQLRRRSKAKQSHDRVAQLAHSMGGGGGDLRRRR